MGIYGHFSRSTFVRSETEGLSRRLPSTVIHPKGLLSGLRSKLCANSFTHVFTDLTPNCSHKVSSMKLSKMPRYAGALRVLFTRTKRLRETPEETTPTP